jgi:hypothetical protein
MKVVYHYTVGAHIEDILRDGVIRPATANVPKGERAIVWFSSNPEWELTANKAWQEPSGEIRHLDKDETRAKGGGLYRIAVAANTAPYNWQRLRFLSKMNPRIADSLEETAREQGSNPDEWFGTFKPVTDDTWLAIEVLTDQGWESAGLKIGREHSGRRENVI